MWWNRGVCDYEAQLFFMEPIEKSASQPALYGFKDMKMHFERVDCKISEQTIEEATHFIWGDGYDEYAT